MKIVLTGVSSFTGYWFAKALAEGGHDVVAPLRGSLQSYGGLKAERIAKLNGLVDFRYGIEFGNQTFLSLIEEGGDIIGHHASEVTNYKSMDFDVYKALQSNTKNINIVLECAKKSGFKGIVYTGSVFEPTEGVGQHPLQAFSPYGLSKGLSASMIQYWANYQDLKYGKFVIPNPFGVLEEERLTAYLFKSWSAGDVPEIKTPLYVRDNIPVDLLAIEYLNFLNKFNNSHSETDYFHCSPSGIVGSQREFIELIKKKTEEHTKKKINIKFGTQQEFNEPLLRINQTPSLDRNDFNEQKFWQDYINFSIKKYNLK
jgi:nucleoside-diphosphate-sugar epimerase